MLVQKVENVAMRYAKGVSLALLILFVLFTVIRCYRSPFSASDLETVPDSVEYAIGAQHFALWGHYEIKINEQAFPPRYPPWFPILLLSPVYALFPHEVGNGIFSILLCAVLCVLIAFRLGYRVGGNWGGFCSASGVVLSPIFVIWSRQIMSDVPALLFALLAGLQSIQLSQKPNSKGYLLAGIFCAIAYAFRNLYVLLTLPFLVLLYRERKQGLKPFVFFLIPTLLVYLMTGLYNLKTFGAWGRNGYHYWCAVPYDYLTLTFSPKYLSANLALFQSATGYVPLLMGILGSFLLLRTKSREAISLLQFGVFAIVPLSLAHLLYFVHDLRFFLPLLIWCLVLGGAGIGSLVQRVLSSERATKWEWILVGLGFVVVFVAGIYRPDEQPGRRVVVEVMNGALPQNTFVVSSIDPVYLEPMLLRGNERRVITLSRAVEYASKVIMPQRLAVLEPPPKSPIDHRCEALLHAGAKEAVQETAEEGIETISRLLREGKEVYLDGSPTTRGDPAFEVMERHFRILSTKTQFLFRLGLKTL